MTVVNWKWEENIISFTRDFWLVSTHRTSLFLLLSHLLFKSQAWRLFQDYNHGYYPHCLLESTKTPLMPPQDPHSAKQVIPGREIRSLLHPFLSSQILNTWQKEDFDPFALTSYDSLNILNIFSLLSAYSRTQGQSGYSTHLPPP